MIQERRVDFLSGNHGVVMSETGEISHHHAEPERWKGRRGEKRPVASNLQKEARGGGGGESGTQTGKGGTKASKLKCCTERQGEPSKKRVTWMRAKQRGPSQRVVKARNERERNTMTGRQA